MLADALQRLATPAATGASGLLVAVDQEGGLVQRLRGSGFSSIPVALVQGRDGQVALQSDAKRWGEQLRAAGVNLDLAPVLDTVPAGTDNLNPPIGAYAREYGHDPAIRRRSRRSSSAR